MITKRAALRSLLLVALLMAFQVAQAQINPRCTISFTVEDTLLLPGVTPETDSVLYHLRASTGADSIYWWPAAYFADRSAAEQWITLGCSDTLWVGLTGYFRNVNLFHWQQPDFVRTHTGYHYIGTPADGSLCQPRSITTEANLSALCPEVTMNNYQNAIVLRTDTLRPYGDSVPVFFDYDSTRRTETTAALMNSLRQLPTDSNYVPFYVDTIEMWNPLRNHTFVMNMNYYRLQDFSDTLAALPSICYSWEIDDTASIFFSVGNTVRMCDTTFFYSNVELPRTGIRPSQSLMHTHGFNTTPRPHGTAVFRFYETPTPYYRTTPYICINRLEMLGDCWAADSLLLTGPGCGCQVRDTLSRSVCRSQLPYQWHGITFAAPGTDSVLITAIACDTFRVLQLMLLPDDTLSFSDTIVQNSLPWTFHGETYMASGLDTLLLAGSIPACDTLLYYQLTVIDNVFDTTLVYICPDELPYSLNGVTVTGDTVVDFVLQGSHGQDSTVTTILYVNHSSDTAIYDTITDDQLPWNFQDVLFNDTAVNYPIHLINERGCDSTIYYNLYIFWNGDHCDSSLTFPNFVTPNGDGINDRFVIGGLVENQCYPYNSLVIYDRTGRLVFQAYNISREDQFWDPAARRMPAGTYFYRFVGRGVEHTTQHQGCIELLK